MTQEEKDIIYKDACGRILYKPYAAYEFEGKLIQVQITGMEGDEPTSPFYGYSFDTWGHIPHDNVKLYLRPMSSMTEEEHNEWYNYYHEIELKEVKSKGDYLKAAILGEAASIDWLNSHYFDYRGLIEKGLAIEVNENNNPYID